MTDLRRLPRAIAEQWAWQLKASCRGIDVSVFYHPAAERNKARRQRIARAKMICQQCPVIAECLDHALRVREPYGIWGGRSEDERAALLGSPEPVRRSTANRARTRETKRRSI